MTTQIDGLKRDIDCEIKTFLADVRKNYKLHAVSNLLFSGIEDFLEREGKRIRPILFLLTYQGYTKRRDFSHKRLLRSSLSFELLHDFLLVHDDIIDRSAMRRGKPTLHRLFNARLSASPDNGLGSGLGIVAGDVIFVLAIEAFLSIDEALLRKEKALRRFIKAAALTGAGEFIDITGGIKEINRIQKKDIFLNYRMKTAKYTFEAPMLIGAILAGAGNRELKKLSMLGLSLGQAFQILDDLSDMFFTDRETGKPVLSDLAESKKTLLAWKAYKDLGGSHKEAFKRLFEKKNKAKNDLIKLKELVKKSRSPIYCLQKSRSLLKEADHAMGALRMKKKSKEGLAQIVGSFSSKIKKLERRICR